MLLLTPSPPPHHHIYSIMAFCLRPGNVQHLLVQSIVLFSKQEAPSQALHSFSTFPPCEPILLSSMLTFNVLSCATVSLTPGIAITVHLAAQTVSDFPYYAQNPPSLFSSSFLFCSHVHVCGPERCFFSRDPACQISCLGEFYFHSLCRTHICLLDFHCPEMSPWPLACTIQRCSAT